MYTTILILLIAYLLGSIPSALIVSRLFAGVDIRTLGDGNMGARNVSRTLGWKRGAIVALIDVGKGLLPVLLARAFGLSLFWRIAAAFCAVLGHDFPIFAHFQGGQGLAATLGALAVLAPVEMAWGMTVYGTLFLITRNSDLGAGVGVGLTVLLMWVFHEPVELIVSSVMLIVSVPAKMMLDRPRRARIAGA
jgi:glycerol-3-phosphate acyltransferase PlsY